MIEIPDKPLNRADYARLAAEILREVPPEFQRLKLALLGSHTTEFLNPCLVVEAARHHIALEIWNGPYGQIEQQALDPTSGLFQAAPDAVLILPELEDLAPDLAWRHLALSSDEQQSLAGRWAGRMQAVMEAIRTRSNMRILLGNLPPPAWNSVGPAGAMLESSPADLLNHLNQNLTQLCRTTPGACVFDVHSLSCEIGWSQWRDARMALLARAPHTGAALTALARLAGRHFRSWYTPPKKCLVLDMDNTLWGGVLGESGLEGIQLGPDYPGNAFVDFQRRILALRDRGILLAAASKNNAADVEQVLTAHPSCLLKREHFSAFEVHWEDKATSLRNIAKTLNIGLDSLVFFDDNPVEREWVSGQLPMVTVIDAPKNPMSYGAALENSLAFDTFTLTEEDRNRAGLYQQEAARSQMQAEASSLEDFIRSLEMEVTLGHFDEAHLPRIVQLLGKTNQFNLTTHRHDQAHLAQMLEGGAVGLWAKVKDRFGDSGLVALAIATPESGDTWMVDSFLMSCRVIGRGVETALLAALERHVRQKGGRKLYGQHIPTPKNQPAADFYPRHGYQETGQPGLWYLCLDEARPLPECFTLAGLPLDS